MSESNMTPSSTDTKQDNGNQTFRWNDLPTEIKDMILEERLSISAPITSRTQPSHSKRALLPVLLANKETNQIATRAWYKVNEFKFIPKPAAALHIQHLILTLDLRDGNTWSVLVAPKGKETSKYARMLRSSAKAAAADSTAWQLTMPNLKSLRIEIVLDGGVSALLHNGHHHVSCLQGVDIDTWFRGMEIKLRAERVVVEVKGLKCGSWSTEDDDPDEICACGCAAKIVRGIQALVELKGREESVTSVATTASAN